MSPADVLLFTPAAFLAGVLMFLAPCTLPIVPGYLAFIAGVPAGEEKKSRKKIIRNAIAFVAGFSIVFIMLGVFAGVVGGIVAPFRDILSRGAGAVIILFGLTMLGVFRIPLLSQEKRIRIPKFLVLGRWESSALIGALFAIGWSPCVGPILGTILFFASTSATAYMGAYLLAVFSFGLAIPFLLCAIGIDKIGVMFERWGRVASVLAVLGGMALIGIGVLMVTGSTGLLITWGYGFLDFLGYDRLLNYL